MPGPNSRKTGEKAALTRFAPAHRAETRFRAGGIARGPQALDQPLERLGATPARTRTQQPLETLRGLTVPPRPLEDSPFEIGDPRRRVIAVNGGAEFFKESVVPRCILRQLAQEDRGQREGRGFLLGAKHLEREDVPVGNEEIREDR